MRVFTCFLYEFEWIFVECRTKPFFICCCFSSYFVCELATLFIKSHDLLSFAVSRLTHFITMLTKGISFPRNEKKDDSNFVYNFVHFCHLFIYSIFFCYLSSTFYLWTDHLLVIPQMRQFTLCLCLCITFLPWKYNKINMHTKWRKNYVTVCHKKWWQLKKNLEEMHWDNNKLGWIFIFNFLAQQKPSSSTISLSGWQKKTKFFSCCCCKKWQRRIIMWVSECACVK